MYNILVCDDDKEIVKAIEIYLSKEGYNILKAYDGMEALEILKKNSDIQLIILDIMMPKLDGIETANIIRKDKSIPIIMLSAKSEDYDKIAGLNNGADDYTLLNLVANNITVTLTTKDNVLNNKPFSMLSNLLINKAPQITITSRAVNNTAFDIEISTGIPDVFTMNNNVFSMIKAEIASNVIVDENLIKFFLTN